MIRLLAHLVAAYLPLAGRHIRIDEVDAVAAAAEVSRETAPPSDDVVLLA